MKNRSAKFLKRASDIAEKYDLEVIGVSWSFGRLRVHSSMLNSDDLIKINGGKWKKEDGVGCEYIEVFTSVGDAEILCLYDEDEYVKFGLDTFAFC